MAAKKRPAAGFSRNRPRGMVFSRTGAGQSSPRAAPLYHALAGDAEQTRDGRMSVRRLIGLALISLVVAAPFIAYVFFPADWITAFYRWVQAQGVIGAFVFAI